MTAATDTLVITANDFGTIFVELNGALIADSATFRRVRGFHNKLTQDWAPAKDFTPRKVAECPERVLAYLGLTGSPMSLPVLCLL